VSSLAGHEPEAHRQIVASNDPRAAAVVASLTAAVLESGDAQAIEATLAPLGRENAAWLHDALLDGLDRFIPGDADKRRTAFLPAEPRALIAFAAGPAPAAKRAADTLRFLRWRGLSLDTRSPLASLSESERAQFERGAREFAICAACHQPNGEGMSGLAPSLVGSPWATGGYAALVRIVLNGKTSGDTTMPPLNALDDETLAAVLTYIRRSWGHESSVITTGQVKAVRSEVALREEPWSEAELAPMN
jgi:mono/diheme cytochrome c family protein